MSVANFRSFLFHRARPPALAHENTQVFTGQLLAVIGGNYRVQAPGVCNAGDMTFPQARKEPSMEQEWADPGGEGGTASATAKRPGNRKGGGALNLLQRGWDALRTSLRGQCGEGALGNPRLIGPDPTLHC